MLHKNTLVLLRLAGLLTITLEYLVTLNNSYSLSFILISKVFLGPNNLLISQSQFSMITLLLFLLVVVLVLNEHYHIEKYKTSNNL